MNELVQIQQEIERVRNYLNDLVGSQKYDINDPEVTSISKYLDSLIVDYHKSNVDCEQQRSE